MLTIKVEENFEYALEQLGITAPIGSIVMTMCDGELLMGVGIMCLFDSYAVIDGIYIKGEFADFSLEYGMGKSMLNVVDLRGLRHAVCSNTDMERVLKSLRFKKTSEIAEVPQELTEYGYYLNLTGYFDANC